MTKQTELDEFERGYLRNAFEVYKNSRMDLQTAQHAAQMAEMRLVGFIESVRVKYGLPEGTEFNENGPILK